MNSMELIGGIIIGILLSQLVMLLSLYLALKHGNVIDRVERHLKPKAVIISEQEVFNDELAKIDKDLTLDELLK